MSVATSFFAEQTFKTSLNMAEILKTIQPKSLLVLDIDDTIGRLPHIIGLDAWFRFRLSEFIEQEDDFDTALLLTIALYNPIQQASPSMIAVDDSFSITQMIKALKEKQISVIGLTARNNELIDATSSQLTSLGFSFSQGILKDASFKLESKTIEIKDGIIYSDGSNKGDVLLAVGKYLPQNLSDYVHITFIDDSIRNCNNMKQVFIDKDLSHTVWHYPYAAKNHQFTATEQSIANTQERYFLKHKTIPSDEDAQAMIDAQKETNTTSTLTL